MIDRNTELQRLVESSCHDPYPQTLLEVIKQLRNCDNEQRFKPKTKEEIESLLPQVQYQAQLLMKGLRPYKTVSSWCEACGNAFRKARTAAMETGRLPSFDFMLTMQLPTNWDIYKKPINKSFCNPHEIFPSQPENKYIGPALAWKTVVDQPGFEINPFERILHLHLLGASEVLFREVQTQTEEGTRLEEMLVVHYVLDTLGKKPKVACLAYPDGRPGDSRISCAHGLEEDCSHAKPLIPFERTIL